MRDLRRRAQLTQIEFAARLGVPVETIRNWEQGKRAPRGPARALLAVIAHSPETVFAALATEPCRPSSWFDAFSSRTPDLPRIKSAAGYRRKRYLLARLFPQPIMGAGPRIQPMLFVEANGARIPAIGLGTWELRGRACARLVEQALRLGYRHIDTAQVYENEREVGEGLRASGVKRDQVFLTTKIWPTHFAPHDLERSAKESLVRLRLTEVDLLLLHWPNPQVPLVETLGALARVRQQGLARHIGVSNFTVALIEEAVASCPEPLVCDQVEYHPYLDQTKVREACARHGMALVAYSPVAKGRIKSDARLRGSATASQDGGASLPALAGAAGRRGDPADVETRAALGEHRDLRLRAVGRGHAADFRDGQRQRPAHRFRFRAEMGLRSCAARRYAGGPEGYRTSFDAMELRRIIPSGITASAIAHVSLLTLVLLFSEVHPFGA